MLTMKMTSSNIPKTNVERIFFKYEKELNHHVACTLIVFVGFNTCCIPLICMYYNTYCNMHRPLPKCVTAHPFRKGPQGTSTYQQDRPLDNCVF